MIARCSAASRVPFGGSAALDAASAPCVGCALITGQPAHAFARPVESVSHTSRLRAGARQPLFVFFPTISTHFRMTSDHPYDGPDIVRAYGREPDWVNFAPGLHRCDQLRPRHDRWLSTAASRSRSRDDRGRRSPARGGGERRRRVVGRVGAHHRESAQWSSKNSSPAG